MLLKPMDCRLAKIILITQQARVTFLVGANYKLWKMVQNVYFYIWMKATMKCKK